MAHQLSAEEKWHLYTEGCLIRFWTFWAHSGVIFTLSSSLSTKLENSMLNICVCVWGACEARAYVFVLFGNPWCTFSDTSGNIEFQVAGLNWTISAVCGRSICEVSETYTKPEVFGVSLIGFWDSWGQFSRYSPAAIPGNLGYLATLPILHKEIYHLTGWCFMVAGSTGISIPFWQSHNSWTPVTVVGDILMRSAVVVGSLVLPVLVDIPTGSVG